MRSRLLAAAILPAAFAAIALAPSAHARRGDTIAGRATVIDGDTLAVEGRKQHIRLYGIDTPEKKQTCDDAAGQRYLCGPRAAEVAAELIGRNGRVVCTEQARDRYGRIVAECALPDGTVLNRAMVASGWALEYDAYSDGRYADAEADAKEARRGLWQGKFIEPRLWRKGERLPSERDGSGPVATRQIERPVGITEQPNWDKVWDRHPEKTQTPKSGTKPASASTAEASDAPASCKIKGNVSASGERIYHLPGSRTYKRTAISTAKGERWFCSEQEAVAAGWRPAKG